MRADKVEMGKRIKQSIEKARITQRSLADTLSVAESTISAYIQGRNEPPVAALVTLASLCSVSLEWLITGKGPMTHSCDLNDTTETTYPEGEELTEERVIKIKEDLVHYCEIYGVNRVIAERLLQEALDELRDLGQLPEGDQYLGLGESINDRKKRKEKLAAHHEQAADPEGDTES